MFQHHPQNDKSSCVQTATLARDRCAPVPIAQVPRASVVRGLKQIRRMRGGAQSQLMLCSDGNYYVVKFKNNPQHRNILANEFLGNSLAQFLGLPTADFAIVDVSRLSVETNEELVIQLRHGRTTCEPGAQFGSKLLGKLKNDRLLLGQYPDALGVAANFRDLFGMLVFDKWTCNTDHRQTIVTRTKSGQYRIWMIDQGLCFNEGYWNFPDGPLYGLHPDRSIYRNVDSFDCFEPWLSKLETEMSIDLLREMAKGIPLEWFEHEHERLDNLLISLDKRRHRVRDALMEAINLLPQYFPNWQAGSGRVAHKVAS